MRVGRESTPKIIIFALRVRKGECDARPLNILDFNSLDSLLLKKNMPKKCKIK